MTRTHSIGARFVVTTLGSAFLSTLAGCRTQSGANTAAVNLDTPEAQMSAIKWLQKPILQKLAKVDSPDQTDQSPVTYSIKRIDNNLCDDGQCTGSVDSDGLLGAKEKLGQDVKEVVKKARPSDPIEKLDKTRQGLTVVFEELGEIPAPRYLQTAGLR